MRLAIDVMLDYWIEDAADVLLQIEVAAMPDQRLEVQDLKVWTDAPLVAVVGEDGIGQRCVLPSCGVKRTTVLGLTPDSLYQMAPSLVLVMP